jgi:hypothetical protein
VAPLCAVECSECGQRIEIGRTSYVSREGYAPATDTRRALGYVLCGDCAGRPPDPPRRTDA